MYLPVVVFLIPSLAAKYKPLIIILVFELLSTLWWLVAFALLADAGRKLSLYTNDLYSTIYDNEFTPPVNMTQASAGLGALEL